MGVIVQVDIIVQVQHIVHNNTIERRAHTYNQKKRGHRQKQDNDIDDDDQDDKDIRRWDGKSNDSQRQDR